MSIISHLYLDIKVNKIHLVLSYANNKKNRIVLFDMHIFVKDSTVLLFVNHMKASEYLICIYLT
jgi:hypothetical protein